MGALIRPRRRLPFACMFAAGLLAAGAATTGSDGARATEISQQQVEAAYLYKFGGYVTWPDKTFAAPDSPIVIGVAQADALAEELTALVTGHTIGNRPVVVRHIHDGGPLTGVNILFIGDGKSAEADTLFEVSRGKPILVVTEGADGLAAGGAVSFVVVDDRVRFDVSLDAVQQNGLKLSALLLSVAHSVNGAKP
ncbi:MAG TPA: YfiR family protein [Gammaproteobacteria bacterium]|nr:YfiR family protein [Gammaproteobacteria bacterium]